MPQLTKDELDAFLPHAGSMRLIDRVESWDDRRPFAAGHVRIIIPLIRCGAALA